MYTFIHAIYTRTGDTSLYKFHIQEPLYCSNLPYIFIPSLRALPWPSTPACSGLVYTCQSLSGDVIASPAGLSPRGTYPSTRTIKNLASALPEALVQRTWRNTYGEW